jgi:hypothetical protein
MYATFLIWNVHARCGSVAKLERYIANETRKQYKAAQGLLSRTRTALKRHDSPKYQREC